VQRVGCRQATAVTQQVSGQSSFSSLKTLEVSESELRGVSIPVLVDVCLRCFHHTLSSLGTQFQEMKDRA